MSHREHRTELIRVPEEVKRATMGFLSNAKTRIDICTKTVTHDNASAEEFARLFLEAARKGVHLRLISSFAEEDTKVLAKLSTSVELRHLDRITSSFGVSEGEYVAVAEETEFIGEGPLLHSDDASFVRHHQDLFEMLWEVATPAESRMRDLEQRRVPPQTRIVRSEEDVVKLVGSFLSRAAASGKNAYAYGVSDKDSTLRAAEQYYESAHRLFQEHPDFRILHITDIQRENLESVKKLIRAGYEVRHNGGNTIRFSVSKYEYIETTHSKAPGRAPDEIVWSDDPQLVAQGKRIFDALWSHALPSDVRIREIEEGVSPETMKIISDPAETQLLYSTLVGAAKYDILLLIPTTNAFHRDEKIGIMEALRAAGKKGVRVSILSPVDDLIEEQYPDFILQPDSEQGLRTEEGRVISLRRISQARTQNAVTIVVADGVSTLIMEEREPSSASFTDALGFATYSTTSPTVRSSIRFFERLRDESDLRAREEVALERERNSRRQAELLQDILSHDIRNYNQVAKSNAELLRDELGTDLKNIRDVDAFVEAIIRATDGSTNLIDRAKKLAKAVSTQEIQLRPVDLGDSLRRAISLVTKAYSEKVITVSLSAPERADVLADDLVDEVFTNILSNAVKYTQGQAVYISVKVEADDSGGPQERPETKRADTGRSFWRVDVEDRGRGIPDELKEKVFRRYATASGGSGLGLSIVHALVTARYKGEVRIANRVENDFSSGTRLEIWLPRAA